MHKVDPGAINADITARGYMLMFVPDPRACRTRKAIGCGGDKKRFYLPGGGRRRRGREEKEARREKSRLTCRPTSGSSRTPVPAPTWKSSFTRKNRRGSRKICHRRQTSKCSSRRRTRDGSDSRGRTSFLSLKLSEEKNNSSNQRLHHQFTTNIRQGRDRRNYFISNSGGVGLIRAEFASFFWWKRLQSSRIDFCHHFDVFLIRNWDFCRDYYLVLRRPVGLWFCFLSNHV